MGAGSGIGADSGAAGGAGEFDEEAQPAFATSSAGFDVIGAGGDDGGPSLEELEGQMRGELAARQASVAATPSARRAAAAAADEDDGDGKATVLPEIDALVARLPADVRDTLDELFRARFISVKKLPKKLLQPAKSKKGSGASEAPSP